MFPQVGRELRHWRDRALQIPDPALRRLALVTQRSERGNLEGAAAFAILAPRAHRARRARGGRLPGHLRLHRHAGRAAEQPSSDPVANGHQLHLALLTALEPETDHPDYYRHHPDGRDDGYIQNLIDTCRSAFAALPSYASVADGALRAARRMIAYQSLNHGAPGQTHHALARWASGITPAGTGLRWWETAAASASSLTVFALIAAAGQPLLSATETLALESAYFPWIGALHVLLDSLIDRAADIQSGQHSLVDHYTSIEEAAARMSAIAARAVRATEMISESLQHAMILAAMTSFYVSAPRASAPDAEPIARRVLEAMGSLAVPTMVVLRARRAAHGLHAKQRD